MFKAYQWALIIAVDPDTPTSYTDLNYSNSAVYVILR